MKNAKIPRSLIKNGGLLIIFCLSLLAANGVIATATNIGYGSGFTSLGLTLNGKAAVNGTRLRLTAGGPDQTSSAFFNTPVNVQSFTNDFSFQLTNAAADGFTFTIQGDGPSVLGSGGGNLGYGKSSSGANPGIGKSVAVKFDLYSNAGEGSDSTGLYTNAAWPGTPSVNLSGTGIDLHSGHTFNVHMSYDGTTLAMQITDATSSMSFRTSFLVNIPNIVGGSTAYLGFTAATGGQTAIQDILSWTYAASASGGPQPLQITTSALPVGAVSVNYNAGLAAANGVPAYTWKLIGGQLPSGLGLQASSGQITGTPTQAGAFTFSVQVKDSSGQTASSSFSVTIAPASAPIVSSVSPKTGPTTGGTVATVSGSNFKAGAAVLFGGVAASSVTISSAAQIQAVTPTHLAGPADVTVRNPDAEASTLSSSFTYVGTPPVTQSLLAGMTPGNFKVPAGWTPVVTQDFEGTFPGNQQIDHYNSITASHPHTGTHSLQGTYRSDGDRVAWFLSPGSLGPFTEVYVSFWEYADPNAMYGNSDYFLIDMSDHTACPGTGQDFGYNAQDFTGTPHPVSSSTIVGTSQGSTSNPACQGFYQYSTARNLAMNAGTWRQVEIHYKPSRNVSAGSDCNNSNGGRYCHGDGEAELYINGQLQQQQLNANLNGTQSMANLGLEIGGTITDFCSGGSRAAPFSKCPADAPTAFSRYIDDIIVMKK